MDIGKIESQGSIDKALQTLKGEQDLASIGAQGDVDVKKIGATGEQERLSQDNTQKNLMTDRRNQSKFARSLAGMF